MTSLISYSDDDSASFAHWTELESYTASTIADLISENIKKFGTLEKLPTFGASCSLVGVSNYEHQIDFFIEFQNADIIGECKLYSERVGVKDALCFLGRKIDIENNNLSRQRHWIFVTNTGFTKHAKKILDKHEIKTARFRSKNDFIVDLQTIFIGLPGFDSLTFGSSTSVSNRA